LELAREFELVTCFQDGLNYLLTQEELEQTFYSVFNRLVDQGLFIFDLSLEEKFSELDIGKTNFIDKEDYSLVYQTDYLSEKAIWVIKITGFVKEDQKYIKFQESHQKKYHGLGSVKRSLELVGFKVLDVFEAFSLEMPHNGSNRVFIIAQKNEGRE
jgi:hypothetical protein